jgi:hypothetical protein
LSYPSGRITDIHFRHCRQPREAPQADERANCSPLEVRQFIAAFRGTVGTAAQRRAAGKKQR